MLCCICEYGQRSFLIKHPNVFPHSILQSRWNHRSMTSNPPCRLFHRVLMYSWRSATLSLRKNLISSTANLEWCHVHFSRDSYNAFLERIGLLTTGTSVLGKCDVNETIVSMNNLQSFDRQASIISLTHINSLDNTRTFLNYMRIKLYMKFKIH